MERLITSRFFENPVKVIDQSITELPFNPCTLKDFFMAPPVTHRLKMEEDLQWFLDQAKLLQNSIAQREDLEFLRDMETFQKKLDK